MKFRLVFLCSFSWMIAVAQVKDLATLPKYDCSLTKVMAIIGRRTIIVSPDNSQAFEMIVNDYCSTFGTNCERRKEASLNDTDFTKSMLLVGVLHDFKKWDNYNLPIKLTPKGFRVNNTLFEGERDAFVFVDSNTIVIAGNNIAAVKDAQLAVTGGHDIVITQHGKITFFGNRNGEAFDWFNLQDLKKSNYIEKQSAMFSGIYISKTFPDTIDILQVNKELKIYAGQFLKIYKIAMPLRKDSWFVHTNMQEYGTMSGMFGLTCPGNNSGGFSIRGEIHTKGIDRKLVKHEFSHFLFDNAVPQEHNPAFFVEGAVEYVADLNDDSVYKQRVIIAKNYKDTLNYSDLIINNKDFYGHYSSADYSVSGVFVKYIIDIFGVDAFKKYCLAANKSTAAQEIFHLRFDKFIEKYKQWLQRQE